MRVATTTLGALATGCLLTLTVHAQQLPFEIPMPADDPPNVQVRYRNGMRFETADQRFTLRIGGRVQARYTRENRESGPDEAGFEVRRARLAFRGSAFDPRVRYKIQVSLNGRSDDGRTVLQDAWIEWRPVDGVGFRGGQFKAPFGRQQTTRSHFLQFQERSDATRYFSLGRQIGIQGSWKGLGGVVETHAGIFNGDGEDRQGALNDNNEHMVAARAQINPFGSWQRHEGDLPSTPTPEASFGASFVYNPQGETTISGVRSEFDTIGYGIDGALRFAGLFATAELFHRTTDEDGSAAFDSIDEDGYFAQAGYFLLPGRLETALRYSRVRVDDGADENTSEITASINYLFREDDHKLQLEWGRLTVDPDGGAETDDDFIRVQWTLNF